MNRPSLVPWRVFLRFLLFKEEWNKPINQYEIRHQAMKLYNGDTSKQRLNSYIA